LLGAALAAPHIARAQGNQVLRFVPQANLPTLDPIAGAQYVVRNAGLLIWDTLFGVDSDLRPRPQMVEAWELSEDGLRWRFRLRPNQFFHDGTTVLARDAVASLQRWMARDTLGLRIKGRLLDLAVDDDRSFTLRLRTPFSKMLFALAKGNGRVAFIMPERLARTDPFKPITEAIGSGPMRFRRDLWDPGAMAVFERFAAYAPRPEPANWMAGGKHMAVDRVEWHILPDAATAAAALQRGEVDWWETPQPDVLPMLRHHPGITVDVADPLGNIGALRMNHLQPPFNDVRARRALQLALSQQDTMRAVVGNNPAAWRQCHSFFTPGTSAYTEAGAENLIGERRYDAAKRLLTEAGYDGAPIVLLAATDIALTSLQADVTAEMLGRIGMNVDLVATDWGTLAARRNKTGPATQGGWHIFHTWHAGGDCISPAAYPALVTTGKSAWFGWPQSDTVMGTIDAWYDAPDEPAELAAIAAINRASMEFVTFIPTGYFRTFQAWRSAISGVVRAPFPLFWGVQKV
jgi:peptide/nickel transport system substrate-binding protein